MTLNSKLLHSVDGIEKLLTQADKTTNVNNFAQRLTPIYLKLHRELFALENKDLYYKQDYWTAEGKYLTYIADKYLTKYDR